LSKEILTATPKTSKEEPFKFSSVLLNADKPTSDGRFYPKVVIINILKRCTEKPELIIQEMNPVERGVKKIPLAEPWSERIMAHVTGAEMEGVNLVIHAECRNNRYGRMLRGIILSTGIENVEFFPVGYGTVTDKNVINPDYKLNYIAMEPKKAK
jgi:hypothetical protein